MTIRRTLSILCGLLLAVGVLVLPTQASASGGYQQISPDTHFDNEWAFQATVNGDHLCLDAANGAASTDGMFGPTPQADVWHCSVGTAPLIWASLDTGLGTFIMVPDHLANGGCLDNWAGGSSNGNPLWMFGPSCAEDNNQQFRLWSNDGGVTAYLAPAQFTTFDPTLTPVVSIASPAGNGSLVHLWHAGANSSLQKLIGYAF